ncbi:MAG TPA: glycine cleavage system aminomethyltransferase GcvT [Cyclobacteriaceae bacterium]
MELKKVALHSTHEALGAKMVPFAGYSMPVRYSSDIDEHKCVRENVGVFDVSHMGEFFLKGPQALDLIQWISTNDASKLVDGQAQYSCMTNEQGGIVDDLIIYRVKADEYMLVVNAANIKKDWEWISQQTQFDYHMENHSDEISLLAVQGPKAPELLQKMTDEDLSSIKFYTFKKGAIGGANDVIISATGYTGEKGFELYVNNQFAKTLWNKLFEVGESFNLQPIGLGARDTLRLEMGLCLYGNDIDDQTSPIEAGLGWITKFTKDFVNAEYHKKLKEEGISRKLVGLKLHDRGIPRPGYNILDESGNQIGKVTSGTLSPMMNVGIGMGYVPHAHRKPGTLIFIEVRNKKLKAEVVKPPIYKK